MIGVRADMQDLGHVFDEAVKDALVAVGKTIKTLIRKDFDEEHAPDGKAWKPRKSPTASWPILNRTGHLKNSWQDRIMGNRTVTVGSTAATAGFHQHGTRWMPARPMVPQNDELPEEWKHSILDSIAHVFAERFS